jgi:assimilatory nitrate reductase catalytic subunit
LTIDELDPVSKMPEFKVCACKLENTKVKASDSGLSDAYQSYLNK